MNTTRRRKMAQDPVEKPVREETKEQFESRMIGHGWCPKCLGTLKNMSDDVTTVEMVCTNCGEIVDEYYV